MKSGYGAITPEGEDRSMKTDYRTVTLTGGFWKRKEDLNRTVTLPAVYDRFAETGRIGAFRCDWKEGMPDKPHCYWDSDVFKWLEGAAYSLYRENDPDLAAKAEAIIDQIERNQGEDGYFNIYFTVVDPKGRFTNRDYCELYCAGHLIEAAVAWFEATGEDRLLRIAEKYAGYLKAVFMDKTAGPAPAFKTPGHQEIELALIRLYRCTGNRDWLDFGAYFINTRGLDPTEGEGNSASHGVQVQSHIPIRRQFEAVGHAVRETYQCAAVADLAEETGDRELLSLCRTLFGDITEKKMYITGGVGASSRGEAFSIPYDLPAAQAYAETCASIGMIFFAHRMNRVEGDAKYADIVEKELYNGMLSGLSLSGDAFFYENPLEIHLDNAKKSARYPVSRRQRIFSCSCCPPNLTRTLSSLGQYFYAWEGMTVWINQFGDSVFEADGMRVSQSTRYPCGGKIVIRAQGTGEIRVRIPSWCQSWTADRNCRTEKGYAVFSGDGEITVDLAMEPTFMQTAVEVYGNLDTAAVQYGPLIYCAEAADNGGDVHSLYLNGCEPDWKTRICPVCGCPHLSLRGFRRRNASPALYHPYRDLFEETGITLIPYHAFANREESNMLVFLRYKDTPPKETAQPPEERPDPADPPSRPS